MSLASLYTFKVIVIYHQLSADDFHVLLQAAVSLVIAVQRRLLSFFFLEMQLLSNLLLHHLFYIL